ncbi:MAG: hypothetical protein NTX24_02440 [Candidatus Pacearchaeota archaeon]|nr:hypothetical protein [Candidatus Pacearchaeota archaeon]
MKILFICKYNRFRSKIAEAFFNKLNKNKKNKTNSAGIIRGGLIDQGIIDAAKDYGIKIKSKPRGLTTELLKWQDTTVIVADDVPKEIFKDNKKYGKKLIIWKISDTKSNKKKEMEKIISQIEIKVKDLVKELD